jgi:simple sugar transport system ATP-binding protein
VAPLLELAGISRRFGAVQALHDADFVLEPGQLHAVLGENGAGKSTLMRVANGLIQPDSGRMSVNGSPAAPTSPRQARALGIGMVHQHFSAVPAFTASENIALAAGWDQAPRMLAPRVKALMERVGLSVNLGVRTEALGVAQRQALEILMALAGEARVLLLDEPTAVLAAGDAVTVLRIVRQFTDQGGGAVLITHKLHEALAYADQITVLRHGRVTWSGLARAQTAEGLARAMLGEAPVAAARPRPAAPGAIVARCIELTVPAAAGGSGLRGATLELRSGELCGVAAVEGNGERELLRGLAGLLTADSGRCELSVNSTFIPEDRTTEALIPSFTLTENRLLAGGGAGGQGGSCAWIDWSAERTATSGLIANGGVVTSGPDARAEELSGGNQQRFVIGRALESEPGLIIAENPNRGLDFKSAAEVVERLRRAARGGASVLFYSVDLDEVLEASDRILVLHNGRVMSPPTGADREAIGRLMLGESG